jgi:sterol desaturase/sphingolipid hydroxylase (fatty acid hydroxylase superfamily)
MELSKTGFRSMRRCIGIARTTASGIMSSQMSAQMFFLDFVVYPLLIIICLIIAFDGSAFRQALVSLALVISGYLIWGLVEYVIHRFVLHHVPFFSVIHKAHHDASDELIGTPTIISAVIFYCVVYWPGAEIFGYRPASAFSAGLLAGYLFYVSVHYAVHHLGSGGYGFMRKLKRRHAIHHYHVNEKNFGVTTGFWDRLFGTQAAMPHHGRPSE